MRAFADAGCRYLQLDEVNFAYLCDPQLREHVSRRGDDPAQLPHIYADLINAAIADIPDDMTITMHLCRGNFRSTFVARGGYEPVAGHPVQHIKVHGYFMEYDTERAGGFEPLRFVPKDKIVVLGLVTTKSGALESKDELKRRIDQAAKYRRPRPALPVAAMRLRLDRGGQSARRGRAMGEARRGWSRWPRMCGAAEQRGRRRAGALLTAGSIGDGTHGDGHRYRKSCNRDRRRARDRPCARMRICRGRRPRRRVRYRREPARRRSRCRSGAAGGRGDQAAGGEAIVSTLSIVEPNNANAIVKAAIDAFGRVDILVNNAGILRDVIFTR